MDDLDLKLERRQEQQEYLEELWHESKMMDEDDPEYAYRYVSDNLSNNFWVEFEGLISDCKKYGLDLYELLESMLSMPEHPSILYKTVQIDILKKRLEECTKQIQKD